jgi:hypothetical protein
VLTNTTKLGWWVPTPENDVSVYRLVVIEGPNENGESAVTRTVFGKKMPAGGDVVV